MRPSKRFSEKNRRRVELIHKDIYEGGLSVQEQAELDELERWTSEWVDKRHPIDFSVIEDLVRKAKELKGLE